jgi:hypothetical protein
MSLACHTYTEQSIEEWSKLLWLNVYSRHATFEFLAGYFSGFFLFFFLRKCRFVTQLGHYRFLSDILHLISLPPSYYRKLFFHYLAAPREYLSVTLMRYPMILQSNLTIFYLLWQYETVGSARENVRTIACLFDNMYLDWVHSPSWEANCRSAAQDIPNSY